jgi:alkyl hydroperoxide reductase subunit AhpC
MYGMIHPNASDSSTVRAVFLIDPDKILRMHLVYPANVGRDFRELLRVIDALKGEGPRSVSLMLDAVSKSLGA